MSPNEWLDPEGSPAFDFPIGVDRTEVLAALDTIPSPRDRQLLVTALNKAAASYRALTLESRDERANFRVGMRELGAAVERIADLTDDADSADRRAELEWARRLAKAAVGDD